MASKLILIISVLVWKIELVASAASSSSFSVPALPEVFAASEHLSEGPCKEETRAFLQALSNITLWGVEMFDASTKFPHGILYGNTFDLGNFDECVELSLPFKNSTIEGQYCLIQVDYDERDSNSTKVKDPFAFEQSPTDSAWQKIKYTGDPSRTRRDRLHWALCVPKSCSADEVSHVLALEMKAMGSQYGLNVVASTDPSLCSERNTQNSMPLATIVFGCISLFLFSLLLTSSFLDTFFHDFYNEKKNLFFKILFCFSARRNLKKLTKSSSYQSSIDASHFMRVALMIFVMIGHRLVLHGGHPIYNGQKEDRMFRSIGEIIIGNGPLIVDAFFTLGGVLLAYGLLNQLEKSKVNLFLIIAIRIIRLTPVYLLLIMFIITILPYMGNGPFWKAIIVSEQNRCIDNWWLNILYINNYIRPENMCMFHSWYLACDFQMFFVSAIIVFIVHYKPILGYCILVLLSGTSIMASFYTIFINNLPPVMFPYPENIRDVRLSLFFQKIYVKTHNRFVPYLVGLIIGIIMFKYRYTTFRLSKNTSRILITLKIILELSMIMSAYPFFNTARPYNNIEAAFYGSFIRLGYALAIGFHFLIFSFGQLDGFKRFLAAKPCMILARLTYGVYMVHPIIHLYDQGSLRVPRVLSLYTTGSYIVADCVLAFTLSLVLNLIIETPFRNLEKLFSPNSG